MGVKLYSWDKWFSHNRFTLLKGRHYRCSNSGMVQQLRNQAVQRGVKVTITDLDSRLVVEILQVGATPEAAGAT